VVEEGGLTTVERGQGAQWQSAEHPLTKMGAASTNKMVANEHRRAERFFMFIPIVI